MTDRLATIQQKHAALLSAAQRLRASCRSLLFAAPELRELHLMEMREALEHLDAVIETEKGTL